MQDPSELTGKYTGSIYDLGLQVGVCVMPGIDRIESDMDELWREWTVQH